MASWNSVFGDLETEPVRGQPASYEAAGSEARRLHSSSSAVQQEFARATSGGDLTELRGDSADRLVHLITEMDGSLADLPVVFGDLDLIFCRHAEALVALRRRVADALARAQTRWSVLQTARAESAAAVGSLHSIQAQLRYLGGHGDPDPFGNTPQVEALQREVWRQERVVAHRQAWATDAAAQLELSRAEYHQLAADELELVAATIEAISQIPLHDLRDPNRLAQFASEFAGDVVDVLVDCGGQAVEALVGRVLELVVSLTAIADVGITESLRGLAIAVKGVLLVHVAIAVGILQLLSKRFPPPYTTGDLASGGAPRVSTDPQRANFSVSGSDDAEVGLSTMLTTLSHTADPAQIFEDEFEIITITDNRFIVVLPGVTDLSRPHFGLDPHTRTVRDLDQHALRSNASVGIDGNGYARMVMDAMLASGVPRGATIMLVGHSFGSDTALDLAADLRFNGPAGFKVTHALAVAYDSRSQMPFVPASTEVLVLQNHRDAAVLVEHVGTPVTSGIRGLMGGLDRVIDREPMGGLEDIVTAGAGIALSPLLTDQLTPRVEALQPGHTQIVFAGGFGDAGHHQSEYLQYLRRTSEPAVRDFASSVGAAGYGAPGSVAALDVSVPRT